jgi:ABC-2 type transport system permease protein
MFIPIDVYPDWLAGIARYTPFAFAAYWPATVFVDFSAERVATTLVGQIIYICLFLGIAGGLFRIAVRRLHVHGG